MLQTSQFLLWFATAALAAATVLYAYTFVSKRKTLALAATVLTGAAFVSQTISIGLRSSATDGTELSGPNSLVLMAWAVVFVYFVVEHLVHLKVYGTVLVPVGLVLLLAAHIFGINQTWQVDPAEAKLLESWMIGFHVFLIMFGNAGFAIAAAASGAYLSLETQLKKHRTSTMFKRLPSLAQTDLVARRAIAFAYPAYTAGMLLGILRAVETDVAGWFADPRVILAVVVWVVFGGYLYAHYGRGASSRTTAWIALVGFIVVVVLAVAARTLPVGFHIFGMGGS